MAISDFGQVGRLISKRFQEGISLPKIEGADLKSSWSLVADGFQKRKLVLSHSSFVQEEVL